MLQRDAMVGIGVAGEVAVISVTYCGGGILFATPSPDKFRAVKGRNKMRIWYLTLTVIGVWKLAKSRFKMLHHGLVTSSR